MDYKMLICYIARAEWYVIRYTGNTFEDDAKYPTLPEPVKIAVILLAESFATGAAGDGTGGGGNYKSETFDDYSYTVAETAYKIDNLDLGPLLDEFVENGSSGGTAVIMRMRKL